MSTDEQRIRAALGSGRFPTEHYARAAGCSMGRAVEILNRLRFLGVARFDHGDELTGYGQKWTAADPADESA